MAGFRYACHWLTAAAGIALTLSTAPDASAQVSTTSRLDFDRPEAWAMKYFTSASLLAATPALPGDQTGQIWLGLELVGLPALSTAQQRVGFNGTTQEDLNQAPLFFRPRITIGLTRRLTLTLAGVPPVHVFGVTPKLLDVGIDWTMKSTPHWTFVSRAHGQVGHVTGAITCPADVLRFDPGSEGNLTGCDATSADATSLRYVAIDLDVARRLTERLSMRASLGVNLIDGVFQTNAHTFGFADRTRLTSRGVTSAGSLGLTYGFSPRLVLGVGVLYAPLRIQRPGESSSSLDSLLTARGILTYRLH
jgi:hypothetical protein